MKLTPNEAARIIDRVSDWLYDRMGQQVVVVQEPGTIHVSIYKEEKKNVRTGK